jgi:hypothetical protein
MRSYELRQTRKKLIVISEYNFDKAKLVSEFNSGPFCGKLTVRELMTLFYFTLETRLNEIEPLLSQENYHDLIKKIDDSRGAQLGKKLGIIW